MQSGAAKAIDSTKAEPIATDELRDDYDPSLIRKGVRGKYACRYKIGFKLVILADAVAEGTQLDVRQP